MPTKGIDDRRIHIVLTSAMDYIKGFRQYHVNFWLCTLLLFLVELGCAILAAPSPMLLETAVCRHHFEKDRQLLNGEPTDEFCRSNEVQVHFAFVITVLSTLSTLAGMQNHNGPPRQRLTVQSDDDASPNGNAWGQRRHSSCFYAECHQYYLLLGMHSNRRTTAFSIMEAISGIADLLGPIIGTMTMTIHLGIPFALALVVFSLVFIPASHLRENTVSDMEGVRSSLAETESLLSVDSTSDRSKGLHELFDTLGVFTLWRDHGPDQTWQSANRDLALSASGAFCCTLGTLIVAAAPNLATVAFGFALSVLGSSMTVTLRSFLASNVQNAFSGRLFAGISMTGTIGSLVGMPIMGAAYSLGINYNIGLPFLVSALSYFLVLGLLVWLASRI
ncbi:hypothetical protein IWW34DRAFT_800568 [Fusarium oxysporum f. sp. albedinis]|nr:hypothetical protein IWW34DRAFT_800568 [Fusarium oxysporum f. sp. albedinis]